MIVNDIAEGMTGATVIVTSLGMGRKMERIPAERNISALLDICGVGMTETLVTMKRAKEDTTIARRTK